MYKIDQHSKNKGKKFYIFMTNSDRHFPLVINITEGCSDLLRGCFPR